MKYFFLVFFPLRYVFLFFIFFYQFFFFFSSSSCRFIPTCSSYVKFCIIKYGVFKGILISFVRLFKCNSFFISGYDLI